MTWDSVGKGREMYEKEAGEVDATPDDGLTVVLWVNGKRHYDCS